MTFGDWAPLMGLMLGCVLQVAAVNGAQYAVIVAGSRGYWNYRHHADVCNVSDVWA